MAARKNTRTPKKERSPEKAKTLFLAAYQECAPNVAAACRLAGIGRTTFYSWLQTDTDFATDYGDRKAESVDALEASAFKRAEESDTLTIFLLKAHRPDVYREKVEQSGAVELRITYDNNWRGGVSDADA